MCGEGEAVNNNSIDNIISNVFDQESVLKKKDKETDEEYQTRVNELLKQTDSVITENKLQTMLLDIASMILKSLKKVSSPTGNYVFRVISIDNKDNISSEVKLQLTYDKDVEAAWRSS